MGRATMKTSQFCSRLRLVPAYASSPVTVNHAAE